MTTQEDTPSYLPGYKAVSHHEWRTAENSAGYLLPHLKAIASKKPSLKLLDVGAGSGTITATLAPLMSAGYITAVDLSSEILDKACIHARGKGITNVDFQEASIYDLVSQFGENSFDVVHAHQVLTHLSEPVKAMEQMLKVVKPGGIVANREGDVRLWSIYPDTQLLRNWVKMMTAVHESSGGSTMAGPSLLAWALKAGAKRENVKMGMGAWMFSTDEEKAAWGGAFRDRALSGSIRDKAIELGAATVADMDGYAAAWQRWIDTEGATCGIMNGEILIWK